jgi:pyrroloquinoline quinone biosynthesis protein D
LGTDRITGEATLLCPERVLLLNATAAAVVERCDGMHTLGEIADALARRYAAPAEAVLDDVADYLRGLRERGLVSMAGDGGTG